MSTPDCPGTLENAPPIDPKVLELLWCRAMYVHFSLPVLEHETREDGHCDSVKCFGGMWIRKDAGVIGCCGDVVMKYTLKPLIRAINAKRYAERDPVEADDLPTAIRHVRCIVLAFEP